MGCPCKNKQNQGAKSTPVRPAAPSQNGNRVVKRELK